MPERSTTEIEHHNQQVLEELCRLLRFSAGEFELVLAVCNSTQQRQVLVNQLRQQCSVAFDELTLAPGTTTLFSTIRSHIGSPPPAALMVYGLDGVQDLHQLLVSTNQIREEFRQFPFPLVVWLTDDGLRHLIRTAPDFYTWANTVTFATPPQFFLAFLDELIADVWRQVVESRENRFLSNQELGLTPGSARCRELETSLAGLAAQGIAITPEQAAGLAFVQGRIADNNTPEAREHYEHSLAQWQAMVDQNNRAEVVEKIGHVQFYLGLWWRNYSVRHRREFGAACQQARSYFDQAIQTFVEAQRPDLAARYINHWAEALHRLEDWPALETVATQALQWHQAQGNPIRQARAEGFLAEVALAKQDWLTAQTHAQTALNLITPSPPHPLTPSPPTPPEDATFLAWVNSFHRSWYVFSLGKAQMGQGQVDAAVQTLEQVQRITQPEYDPLLYSQTLEYLRRGYFDQGHYLQAFETRREKEAIESRFNFRAFVGAGRLQPKQQITNPALPAGDHSPDLIMASGRRQDVSRLVTRLEQDEFVLTIVYGPSGVGKSSLIEAGLVPTLEQQRFGGRQVVPVRLRSYGNWVEDVLGAMPKPAALAEPAEENAADLETLLLDLLRQQTQVNRVIILIFDQFEEFFFACEQPAERLRFYNFLRGCLTMPFIKVVLSLREDYTHYLLECNRLTDLAIIDNNILDKNWIYYLGNFSPEDATGVISDLTQPTPYAPAVDLVERVVADLAAETGEVRPIELQIVGSQLQAEGIDTLEDYQGWIQTKTSIKATLVQQYLNDVMRDCGPAAHQQLANLVLYLLTDERGTRPLKTQAELLNALHTFINHTELDTEAFGLVLQILTQSGLVVQVPNAPDDRYQLVHDYLAAFLRSSQQPLMAQLEQERQLRLVAEQQRFFEQQKRIGAEREQLRQAQRAVVGLGTVALVAMGAGVLAWVQQHKAAKGELNAQFVADSLAMEAYLNASLERDAVTQAVQTGQTLQSIPERRLEGDTRFRALSSIREVVYEAKERERLIGHTAPVRSVAFSPDGNTIATASNDKTVKLWSTEGEELRTLPGHNDEVWSVAFSPDGTTIATASKDNFVRLWSIEGDKLGTLGYHGADVRRVAFSPDGNIIATASRDNTVKLWSIEGKELRTIKGHSDEVWSVAFSPDGTTIATASSDNTVKLWSIEGEELRTIKGHSDDILSVVFSLDGNTIATASSDNTVKLWSTEGEELQTLKGHSDEVWSVAFSHDGTTIATASNDNTVKLWSTEGEELQTLKGHSADVRSVAFKPIREASSEKNGITIATISWDGTGKLWSIEGEEVKTLKGHQGEEVKTLKDHSDNVNSVAFSPDGTIATASNDKTVQRWNIVGKELKPLKGHSDTVNDVAFSPDGTIATASKDKTVQLWSPKGEKLQPPIEYEKGVLSVAFSPDGNTIATITSDNETVQRWNREGKELEPLKGHSAHVIDVAFSPDGDTIATTSWDKTAKLWSIGGEERQTLNGHSDAVRSVAFSPDGTTIATASNDDTVKLWSIEGEELRTFKGHSNDVVSVAFSPDSTTIATASLDNTVKLWSIEGEELQTLNGHSDAVDSVAFSPDGNTIATASDDDTVKLWNFRLEDLLNRGCDWLGTYFVKQSPELLMELEVCQDRDPDWLIAAAPTLAAQGISLAKTEQPEQSQEAFHLAKAFVIKWITYEQGKPYELQAEGWIEALEQGENPFTPEVLKDLRRTQ